MSYTERLKNSPQMFRNLTGISPEEFAKLLTELTPRYDEWNIARLSKTTRPREIGAGGKFALSLEDRLLMLLMYYRCYMTHAFLGFLFGIDDSNVGRNMKPLERLLAGVFRIPEKRIKVDPEEVTMLFIDGTEQKIQRPKYKQKRHYSGKKKAHTRKVQVAARKWVDKEGKVRTQIVGVSKSVPGKVHDKKLYDQSRMVSSPQIPKRADTGYQGTNMDTPHKKSKKPET